MASTSDDEGAKKNASPKVGSGTSGDETRRHFLKAGLAFAVVLVVAGIAAVAGSLISPPNPPQAQEVLPPAPPQTTTITEIETETVSASASGSQSKSSSASQSESSTSSSSSSSSTSETSSTASSPFPKYLVANISSVTENTPVYFNYPLEETPSILVKMGVKGTGGVGPDGDIVAFSQVCQHLGCDVGYVASGGSPACDSSYKATGPEAYCCCHGSVYDLTDAAKVVSGPAPLPLPQVTLEYDASTGDIYAVGMGPPTIFGYHTGSDNVLYDLQGGTPV